MIPVNPLVLALVSGASAFKTTPGPSLVKPYKQNLDDQYSPLRYLGGLGPYVTRSGNGISPETPEGCEVDQVVLLQRHGERYPDWSSVKGYKKVLKKITEAHPGIPFTGDLEFYNTWDFFLKHDGDAGLETASGPYAGLADLYDKGATFAGKYGHLWDGSSSVPLFVSGSERVIQSARKFGEGFFGFNYTDVAQLNIISEEPSAGGDSLNPYFCANTTTTSCELKNTTNLDAVYDIVFPEFDIAAVRLNKEHGLTLTGSDVGELFEIASFDFSVNGYSPWLDVFTRDEWIAYNYRQALWFNCYFGPDSLVGKAGGTNFANATAALLNSGPDGSGLPLVLNFAHDTDITMFLAGMDILTPLRKLSTERVTFDTRYELNDIVPMGAQLVLERLRCKAPYLSNSTDAIDANASLPDSYLNSTYGVASDSAASNVTGYFPANAENSTVVTNVSFVVNGSDPKYQNGTSGTYYDNSTLLVLNGTNTTTVINTTYTQVYGFNASAPGPQEDSFFVRLVLNDAIVPIDYCYDGPGYSCSLSNWTSYVAKQTELYNFEEYCKPAENNVPERISFYWDYNKTTEFDEPKSYIPWQGSHLV